MSSATRWSSITLQAALATAASARCLARLSGPKCEGKRSGGRRRIAFVPVPSREGTTTIEGPSPSCSMIVSMSPAVTSGRSIGSRKAAVAPRFFASSIEIN